MRENAVMSRRAFLGGTVLTTGAVVSGCATNPVTGKRQLMLITTAEELAIDQQHAPHQFSADYGPVQDPALQAYLQDVTERIARTSHRPDMPYRTTGLYASYVNGYTFPAGSIGVTRGILAELGDEAALAALIGHEIGHVNARHSARRMTNQLLTMLVLGLGAAVLLEDEKYAPLVLGIGAIGAGALLARYSRENEREADKLGMDYMVAAGYPATGMVALMDMLRSMEKRKPNIIERMFSSHPMSEDRHRTAIEHAQNDYAQLHVSKDNRERYMDMTSTIRAQKPVLHSIQNGDSAMQSRKWHVAETEYRTALRRSSDDYEGLLKMAQCQVAQDRLTDAVASVKAGRVANPQEPLSYQLGGLISLRRKQYEEAHQDFETYLSKLPGNPLTVFYNGQALEGMGRRNAAAQQFKAFLQQVGSGDEAEYARSRLQEWGMLQA